MNDDASTTMRMVCVTPWDARTRAQKAKQARALTLELAREYASQGRHDDARALFASEGISYLPSPVTR